MLLIMHACACTSMYCIYVDIRNIYVWGVCTVHTYVHIYICIRHFTLESYACTSVYICKIMYSGKFMGGARGYSSLPP